jgi:toxin ParE1/3/4
MAERRWRVRLGAAAEVDFANILKWTTQNFGARQSRVYRNTLVQAIGELADGPDAVGSKARNEIMAGLRTLDIARRGRRVAKPRKPANLDMPACSSVEARPKRFELLTF